MLYIFYGTDIQKSHIKAKALIDSLRTKRPDATFVSIDAESWSPAIVDEHMGGQGLFSSKYIIYIDRVNEKSSNTESLLDTLSVMKTSENIFVLLEGKINADTKKKFEKHADKLVVTDVPEVKKSFGTGSDFNIFSLADAIGERNSLKAWSIFRTAIEKGHEPEAIVGTLFWQVKSMIVASGTKSASESGLSPFVYSKAKKASEKYGDSERIELLQSLVSIYHDGHRGMVDIELGLERLLLGL
jgi:DNA polymerase III delta subunit